MTPAQREADVLYRSWTKSGPMWTSESDAKLYTEEQQKKRVANIEAMRLENSLTRQQQIDRLNRERVALRNSLFENHVDKRNLTKELEGREKYNSYGGRNYDTTEIKERLREIERENKERAKELNNITTELNKLSMEEDEAQRNWLSRRIWPFKPYENRGLLAEPQEAGAPKTQTPVVSAAQPLPAEAPVSTTPVTLPISTTSAPVATSVEPAAQPEQTAEPKVLTRADIKRLEEEAQQASDKVDAANQERKKAGLFETDELNQAIAEHEAARKRLADAIKKTGFYLSEKEEKERNAAALERTRSEVEREKAADAERQRIAGLTQLQKLQESQARLKSELAALKAAKGKRELTREEEYRLVEYPSMIEGYKSMIADERAREAEKAERARTIRGRLSSIFGSK